MRPDPKPFSRIFDPRSRRHFLQLLLTLLLCISLPGCDLTDKKDAPDRALLTEESIPEETSSEAPQTSLAPETASAAPETSKAVQTREETSTAPETTALQTKEETEPAPQASFSLSELPAYSGSPFVVCNDNTPYFTAEEKGPEAAFEIYSRRDALGRCGAAFANVGRELMPTEERGPIGDVKPTGWHTVKYQGIDGNYLYNRCHLIGYQLTGENANEENLITGTRYLNINGMLPFENAVAEYVNAIGNHVLYRVTPIFNGEDLLASGVLMEGWSVEDHGKGISFCVFCYNVQPGIQIDYADGSSSGPEFTGSDQQDTAPEAAPGSDGMGETKEIPAGTTYICNTNTRKFHLPGCPSVKDMKTRNMKEVTCDREELIKEGYAPCKRCAP